MLDGPSGIGKSSTMLQIAHIAMTSEDPQFFVLYIPSGIPSNIISYGI